MKSFCFVILSAMGFLFAATGTEQLLVKGDGFYFKGDMLKALEYYYEAENSDPENAGAMTGIYNASINSGGIKTANKYANKLIKLNNSELNQDRVIYSDALLGKTSYAEKLLRSGIDYFRKKQIYSLAGRGLSQTGYYQNTADWYNKAMNGGFGSEDFRKAYSALLPKLNEDRRFLDVIFSFYDYGSNELLLGGYNFNINYNFGKARHRFNTNFVMQGTRIDPAKNQKLGFLFYDDIGQYEFFGQYNYTLNSALTVYGGIKGSVLVNDYIQNLTAVSAGARFGLSRYFTGNTFVNYSGVNYNFYDINDKKYSTFSNSFSSIQYTFDGAFNLGYLYLGGIVNIVEDINSDYASDMLFSDRDTLITELSPDIVKGGTRFLYGATAGFRSEDYDIFTSYSTGDIFLVNTGEGRYLNTNDSKLKTNIIAGVIFRKLFGDWILGYTVSFSDFEDYTILTNSITANYNWRVK